MNREEINQSINQSPGSSQDINRVLQTLPAVSGGGNDLWNDFYVRGGSSKNGYVLDGMELNNLSHWRSQFQSGGTVSFLHLDMIKDLQFYAVAPPSYLPSKLSSVTNIRLREGNRKVQVYQWDLNMAGTGVFLEGPIGSGSYMLNYRMSFLELLSSMIPIDGTPDYHNLQG